MIMIVEDEAISRRALQHLLRLSGLKTRAAASAEEAIGIMLQGGPPELALVDINLPGMNGVEFVAELHRQYPNLPCVFMTANEDALNDQIRSACPEPTFRKPFDVPELLHLINSTIRLNPLQHDLGRIVVAHD